MESNGEGTSRAGKVARTSSAATVGAAIVDAENSLEAGVCFFFLHQELYAPVYHGFRKAVLKVILWSFCYILDQCFKLKLAE